MLLGVDWSSEANALRSLSLIAEEVMPAFQGTTARRQEWWTKYQEGVEGYSVTMANAIEGATRGSTKKRQHVPSKAAVATKPEVPLRETAN